METLKGELTFSKEEYMALPEEKKQAIKHAFLFSRRIGGWVSRAKYPNLYSADRVAKSLGAEFCGKTGEALTFAEQMERKAERAEARAERMETHADNAEKRAEALQAPINSMHGDIAFFTQPNINTSGGRSFTNRRNKMFSAYERGFEEFKKSEYFRECAETARKTAKCNQPTDKAFCERRIREAESDIRKMQKAIKEARGYIEAIQAGETPKNEYGWTMNANVEQWEKSIERWEFTYEQALGKLCFYQEAMEALGGVQFSRDNIKPGYIVKTKRDVMEVISCGPKNFTGKSRGLPLSYPYAEIVKVLEEREPKKIPVPYSLGDKFTVDYWTREYGPDGRYLNGEYVKHVLEVVKMTEKSITILDSETGKKFNRKPTFHQYWNGETFCNLSLPDEYRDYISRKVPA